MTEGAYQFGEAWYKENRKRMRAARSEMEANFFAREQTQLHKLAMVISVSKNEFPVISEHTMQEADFRLKDLSKDASRIFNVVGQSSVTRSAAEVVAILKRIGPTARRELYRRTFFRTLSVREYGDALQSAAVAGFINLPAGDDAILSIKEIT